MPYEYRVKDQYGLYFITNTVHQWVDVFTRKEYADIVVESLIYCKTNKGLRIHAWCIMSNHLHLILSASDSNLSDTLRDFKKFTAKNILEAIQTEPESRREWMLDLFEKNGKANKSNFRFQFWQHENHPVLLDSNFMLEQRMNYLHENPVRAGFVTSPEQWLFSSAVDYYTEHEKGLLTLVLLT